VPAVTSHTTTAVTSRTLAELQSRPNGRAVSAILATADEPFRNRVRARLLAAGCDNLEVADLPGALAQLLRNAKRTLVVVGGTWPAPEAFLRVAVNAGALPLVLLESSALEAEGEALAMGARAALQFDLPPQTLAAALAAVDAGLIVLEPSARALLRSANRDRFAPGPRPSGATLTSATRPDAASANAASANVASANAASANAASANAAWAGAVSTGAVSTGAVSTGAVSADAVSAGAASAGAGLAGAALAGAASTGPAPAGAVSTDAASAGAVSAGAVPAGAASAGAASEVSAALGLSAVAGVLAVPKASAIPEASTMHRVSAQPDVAAPRRTRRSLTAREREILGLVASGSSNKGIARVLSVSANTVKFHLAAVFDKLNAGTRAEAVAEAIRRGELAL
jgi:DNA-binding NarL/FixJ family response regulator